MLDTVRILPLAPGLKPGVTNISLLAELKRVIFFSPAPGPRTIEDALFPRTLIVQSSEFRVRGFE